MRRKKAVRSSPTRSSSSTRCDVVFEFGKATTAANRQQIKTAWASLAIALGVCHRLLVNITFAC